MTQNEELEVSVIRTMLRILRYDEFQAKALCRSVALAVIEDRKLSESASETIMDYVNSMTSLIEDPTSVSRR